MKIRYFLSIWPATWIVLASLFSSQLVAQQQQQRAQAVEIGEAVELRVVEGLVQDEEADGAEGEESEEEEAVVKGPINDAAESLRQLMSLDWENGVLVPTLMEGRQEVQQTIYAIRSASGGGGMSSSSSGDNSWWYQFQGQRLMGTFQNNWPRNVGTGQLMFKLTELESPYRELKIEKLANDDLSILLSGGDTPFVLRIRQKSNGEFIVQEVNGTEVFSFREPNFGEFCRRHVDYSQTRMLPMLREVGINPPATPQDLSVQQHVIDYLRPIDPARLEEFRTLISELDSTTFDVREAASEAVSGRFPEFRDIAIRIIDDEQYSAEARSRLLALLKDNSEDEQIRTRDLASRLGLQNDGKYLVWLLSQQHEPDKSQVVRDRLTEMAGEDHGDDLPAWREWAGQTQVVSLPIEEEEVDLEALFADGQILVMSDQTSTLVKLAVVGDELVLDRDHWSQPFGGKSLQQLSEEIKAELRERGLPESYFSGIDQSRYPMLGYPHVLFENFYQELLKHPQSTNYRGSRTTGSHQTPNRHLSVNGLECSLSTQPGANGRVIGRADTESTLFRFRIAEVESPRRSISIEEDADDRIRIELTCEDCDTIVRLIELPDDEGWIVQDLRGTKVFAEQAESYADLYSAHQSYFDETFYPMFRQLGFQPPDHLDAADATASENESSRGETDSDGADSDGADSDGADSGSSDASSGGSDSGSSDGGSSDGGDSGSRNARNSDR